MIKLFPTCMHARNSIIITAARPKHTKRCLCLKAKSLVRSPASRKTQKLTEELIYLEGTPYFSFNNRREVEHGSPDLC